MAHSYVATLPHPTLADVYRSRSVEVAAQCGVVDDKVLRALQHIDEALEAEVSWCTSTIVWLQLQGMMQVAITAASELIELRNEREREMKWCSTVSLSHGNRSASVLVMNLSN